MHRPHCDDLQLVSTISLRNAVTIHTAFFLANCLRLFIARGRPTQNKTPKREHSLRKQVRDSLYEPSPSSLSSRNRQKEFAQTVFIWVGGFWGGSPALDFCGNVCTCSCDAFVMKYGQNCFSLQMSSRYNLLLKKPQAIASYNSMAHSVLEGCRTCYQKGVLQWLSEGRRVHSVLLHTMPKTSLSWLLDLLSREKGDWESLSGLK